MNLELDYINKITNYYFSDLEANPDESLKSKLITINQLAIIFNKYIDYAQESRDFTDLSKMNESLDFQSALAHNLLFIFQLMKTMNISYEEVFDKYIKHGKSHTHYITWAEMNQTNTIQ